MEVLAVGAGRDGTASLTGILQDIMAANQMPGEAVHEYGAERFYNLFSQWKEHGDEAANRELDRLIAECPDRMVVGNGYQMVLDRFLAHFPGLRLIAIRRRDKAAHLASLEKIATMWPEVFAGYTASSGMKRVCAYHLGAMTEPEWNALPLRDKLEWYRESTYEAVEHAGRTASGFLEVYTEDLDHPDVRQKIADFVAFPGAAIGDSKRLNRRQLVALDDFDTEGGRFALWWFRNFSPGTFATSPGYGPEYALGMYRKWLALEADVALGVRGKSTDPSFDMTLDQLSEELVRFQDDLAEAQRWSTEFRRRVEAGLPRSRYWKTRKADLRRVAGRVWVSLRRLAGRILR